ncbi:hypothetical protein ACG98G_11510 [Megasphaera hexanoica]|jgi:hypothetical protein|uniref:Uncharacterized protein n=1 Tax=Megasphaera hexanoica TaxID=1675036 RepID=A0A848BT30_9FIRM|nr:hypothetical protein [Megasphaera hexanoica]MCI5531936.1 hypothetical protein [Caecibacter massiliensis]NME27334.1 hypothetical protein [Megasphaera hexanoica]
MGIRNTIVAVLFVCLACTAVYGFVTVDRPGVQAAAQASSKPDKSK